ncbi:uncharacterized protein DS421_3g98350 [Arachis hypogaea]|nr:uncharacterized protein DS421_3g98350 [Arachis hypogaea]
MSFECIEWHATDRVRRQFGMQQLLPGPAFDLGCDHCKRLTGAQNHEWGQIYSQWVNRWTSDRYNTLQLGEEIIDFHPLPVYYDWYTQQYEIHLRLSDRVLGEEVGADEPQQQQEEPADSHQEVPPHEQQEHVPAYEHHYQVPEYEHQFQDPAYAQQFQDPAYVQQFQDPAYAQQWPTYHPLGGLDTVHTLGRAIRHGMIDDKATDLFRSLYNYYKYTGAPRISSVARSTSRTRQLRPSPTSRTRRYRSVQRISTKINLQFQVTLGTDTISFSEVLRDTYFLGPMQPQEGPAISHHSSGRRATSGHTSDFDFDHSTGHVDLPGPSAPPRGQLFDLNEYLQQEEGDLGYDLQHWYDLGGSSAPGMSGIGLYDTGCASMTDFDSGPDVDSGLDAGVSQGHPYNLRTQTAPSNKYTPSLYSKKVPRK